ncbi:uncharacterized protein LOC111894303 [Lactuca sativa]|uniref:uncharacterized protein LOC111894303 n=1 Tax=Lactuca sativa TaxID=4236 RepID=UPI000CD9A2FC|nr:uncharacterized protein LOC111894303 [Lactuca sativa]
MPKDKAADKKVDIMARAHSAILLSLTDEKQWLCTLRMSESTQVKGHLDNFNRIILDLQGVDVNIEYEDQEIFDEGDDGDVLTVCTSSSADAWVLDSGASYHMTYNCDWVDSFKEWDGTVKMGDYWVSSIKGSATVQIKMHDGMVRKLDFWYVPELWKNLVSLSTLAKNRIRYVGEGD